MVQLESLMVGSLMADSLVQLQVLASVALLVDADVVLLADVDQLVLFVA